MHDPVVVFVVGDGETQCLKVRSDKVQDGPSLRSQTTTGPCGLSNAGAEGNHPLPVPHAPGYFVSSLTRWPSSGRISFSIARRTAFSDPGVENSTRPLMMPAVARLMMAGEPMS